MTAKQPDRHHNRWAALTALAILAVTAVELFALTQGINGNALTAAIATLTALGGATAGKTFQ